MDDVGQSVLNYIAYINSSEIQMMLFPVKAIFILAGLFLVFIYFYCAIKYPYYKFSFLNSLEEFVAYKPFGFKPQRKRWEKIANRLQSNDELEYKLAVLEADQLTDEVFAKMNLGGSNLEERIQSAAELNVFSKVEGVRKAHTYSQQIAQNPDIPVSKERAEEILGMFEQMLQDLDVM